MSFNIKDFLILCIQLRLGALVILPKVFKYWLLSSCRNTYGTPRRICPLLLVGKGKISFGKNVTFGVIASTSYYAGYSYIEARNEVSSIVFGNNITVNNNASIVCEGTEIIIDDDVLIGANCSITDSDFHSLDPLGRRIGIPAMKKVHIKRNAFIGSNVIILKGVSIGINSIIGSGSIVTTSIPDNVIAAGNPAKVLRMIF